MEVCTKGKCIEPWWILVQKYEKTHEKSEKSAFIVWEYKKSMSTKMKKYIIVALTNLNC